MILPLPRTRDEMLDRRWRAERERAQRLVTRYAPRLWRVPVAINIIACKPDRCGEYADGEPPQINIDFRLGAKAFLDTLAHEIAHANVGRTGPCAHCPTWHAEYLRLKDLLAE
jgi:hypothetical protein